MGIPSALKLGFTILFYVLLFVYQNNANPLNKYVPVPTSLSGRLNLSRPDFYELEIVEPIERRAPTVDLETLWNGITGGNKVPVGGCTPFTLDPTVAASFTTALFYGCTVVVVVDGQGVIIGHFAQESATPGDPSAICYSMNNKRVVEDKIIDKLLDAEMMIDTSENTHAFIITPSSVTSVGYQAIQSNLQQNGLTDSNIHHVYYPPVSPFQDFKGPAGKAVVTWTPDAPKGEATLKVYIQNKSPTFKQTYDSNGNPVSAPACDTHSKHKRQAECALPEAVSDFGSGVPTAGAPYPANASTTTTTPTVTAASDVPATTTTDAPTITAPPATTPAPSCYQQNQDPDQGIFDQGCICSHGDVTKTLPILATGVLYGSSCAYTALTSVSMMDLTPSFGPPVTNSMICSVCSPIADLQVTCTSLSDCLPQTPTATIQIGSSPVPVGTLTADALSSAISSAVSSLCPPVTQTTTSTRCDETSKVTIPGIYYIEDDFLAKDGELVVQIDSSGYNDTALLGPMIGMAALSISSSATGDNCYEAGYTVETLKTKRWYSSVLDTSLGWMPFYKRDHPHPEHETIQMCHSGHFASPQVYGAWWRDAPSPGPSNYISVAVSFKTGPGGELLCAFIDGLVEAVEATFTPELLGAEQYVDQEINISCEEAMSLIGG